MKTQIKYQKILTLVTLILAALTTVFALFFCSGILNAIRNYTKEYSPTLIVELDGVRYVTLTGDEVVDGNGAVANNDLIGAEALFSYTQGINIVLLIMAIVFILLVAFAYITRCNARRNYYVTNYVAIGILVAYVVTFAITLLVIMCHTLALVNEINFDVWEQLYEVATKNVQTGKTTYSNPHYYSKDITTCILGIILVFVLLADAAAWVLNAIWKTKLMQGEKALLQATLSEEVA